MVTIAGKTYRIACAEGEERHLEGLAASYDAKIREMRGAFGEIGDMRLHVMAAITWKTNAEMRKRMAAMEAELADLRRFASAGDERTQPSRPGSRAASQRAAERIEQLARSLNAAGQV
jgi:cell division protein ZapA